MATLNNIQASDAYATTAAATAAAATAATAIVAADAGTVILHSGV